MIDTRTLGLAAAFAAASCSAPSFAGAPVDAALETAAPDASAPDVSAPEAATPDASAPEAAADVMAAPRNDDRASATPIAMTAAEVVVTGTTEGATFDGPTDCADASGPAPNVWYRVTFTERGVFYADTAGSLYDTRLYVVDAAGETVAGTCNDDARCTTGGFTSMLQSRSSAVLGVGTYAIAVSGYRREHHGAFTLRLQHVPLRYGSFFYMSPIHDAATTTTLLVGESQRAPSCSVGPSGEDVRWFVSCGGSTAALFSLCPGDGGSFVRRRGALTYDPVMYVYSALTGREVQCNDDGGAAYNCRGTGGDAQNYGARIEAPMPRGLNALVVDERERDNGLVYTLRYRIP